MNSMATRVSKGIFWLVLGLMACGTVAKPASEPIAESLCPTCVAGGETTDFDGEVTCFTTNVTPIDWNDPLAEEFGVSDITPWLEQPMEISFGWRRQTSGSLVTGYQRETELGLQIQVLRLSHADRVDISNVQCGSDFLLLDSRVQLATADGALSVIFERPIRLERGANTVYLGALGIEDSAPPIELGDFVGTLDLALDTKREHRGAVALSFSVGPGGARGKLEIVIQYLGEDGEPEMSLAPIRAQWPSDGCDSDFSRVDSAQMINAEDGRSAEDYMAQMTAQMIDTFPVSARWLDGSETELDLELGEMDTACENLGSPRYYVAAPLTIRSADGLLLTTQEAQVHFRTDDESDELVTVRTESTERAAFAQQFSASDIVWGNDFEASFELLSRRSQEGKPQGDLQILGYDGDRHNRLYLYWCAGQDCNAFPRPKDD